MQFSSFQDPWLALYGFIFRIDRCIKRPRYKMVSSDVRIHGAVAWQGGEFLFNLQSKRNMTCYTAVRGYNQLLANVTEASQLWLNSGINDW